MIEGFQRPEGLQPEVSRGTETESASTHVADRIAKLCDVASAPNAAELQRQGQLEAVLTELSQLVERISTDVRAASLDTQSGIDMLQQIQPYAQMAGSEMAGLLSEVKQSIAALEQPVSHEYTIAPTIDSLVDAVKLNRSIDAQLDGISPDAKAQLVTDIRSLLPSTVDQEQKNALERLLTRLQV